MAKILIIYRVLLDEPSNEGIKNKLLGQIEAFRHHGLQVDSIYLNRGGLILNKEIHTKKSLVNLRKRYVYHISKFYSDLLKIIQEIQPDFIYFRHFLKTPKTIDFFNSIKYKLPNSKVIIEVPTYPYRKEYKGLLPKVLLAIDQKMSKRLSGLIDLIVHFGKEDTIWKIPAIGIQNGVIPKQSISRLTSVNDEIIFVGVGKLWDWWGLDLFIKAINSYRLGKEAKNVKLIILGEGKELSRLQALVKKLKADRFIFFKGNMTGKAYDEIICAAHIGVGTLAIDRKGVKYSSSLKHREYASYGLPFFYCGEDKDFMNQVWALSIKEVDQPLSVEKILSWYENLQIKNNLITEIQSYTKEHLSWDCKIETVVDAIKLLENDK